MKLKMFSTHYCVLKEVLPVNDLKSVIDALKVVGVCNLNDVVSSNVSLSFVVDNDSDLLTTAWESGEDTQGLVTGYDISNYNIRLGNANTELFMENLEQGFIRPLSFFSKEENKIIEVQKNQEDDKMCFNLGKVNYDEFREVLFKLLNNANAPMASGVFGLVHCPMPFILSNSYTDFKEALRLLVENSKIVYANGSSTVTVDLQLAVGEKAVLKDFYETVDSALFTFERNILGIL